MISRCPLRSVLATDGVKRPFRRPAPGAWNGHLSCPPAPRLSFSSLSYHSPESPLPAQSNGMLQAGFGQCGDCKKNKFSQPSETWRGRNVEFYLTRAAKKYRNTSRTALCFESTEFGVIDIQGLIPFIFSARALVLLRSYPLAIWTSKTGRRRGQPVRSRRSRKFSTFRSMAVST